MRKLFLLLTFLSFVLPHLVAQTSVRYYGRVSDESNHGIEAVDVTVDGLPYGTSTDSSGRYSFEFETNLPKLTLRFEQFGYGVMTSVQKVKAGSHRVNVTLRDSSVMLSGVSVSEVSRQTASVSRLPVERLKETPSANGGIEGLITFLP